MQFLAITSWAQLAIAGTKYPHHLLMPYFQGFSITLFVSGMIGTILGYFLPDLLPPNVLQIVVFITPIYIFLLIFGTRNVANRISVLLGGIMCALLYPLLGEMSIIISGIAGGTTAYLVSRFFSV